VKVLDCYGAGDAVATARGILYAARMGARVINMSLGGYEESQTVRDAVAQASRDYGALSVAAAGNSGAPGVSFPARIPEVLAVGATAANGSSRAAFSSYGPEVDVVAVGESVVGPVPASACNKIIACFFAESYGASSGTSFSAPQAAGVAALLLSANRGMSPQQLTDAIKGSATPLSDGSAPGWAGSGRINAVGALRAAQTSLPPGDPCVINAVIDGDSFQCTNGVVVRMLQIDAPDLGQCGGQWAFDAMRFIFLPPGRTVSLQYDASRTDQFGRTLAVPIWRGNDGADYNLSIVLAYVGLALAADVGPGNAAYRDWAIASQNWAAAAQWNMWAPGKTFNGGC
jgi:endonuclease YncB( thermonuclease family)